MRLHITLAKTLPPTLYSATIYSPWGSWAMAMADDKLYACSFIAPYTAAPQLPLLHTQYTPANLSQAEQMQTWMNAFVNDTPNIVIPLALYGTPFQCKVWQALSKVLRGQTAYYADLATAIGSPKALQAVGTAVKQNHLAPFLACHRIIPRHGGIGNYFWGMQLKAQLLAHEGIVV